MPTTAAVVAMPANSTSGRYHTEMRTDSMCVVEGAVALGESVTHCLLTAERLDDPHAGDALLE